MYVLTVFNNSKEREGKPTKRQARKISVDEEEAFSSGSASRIPAYQYPNMNQPMAGGAPGSSEEPAAQNELYQAAYAHAYAQLQAQFQSATPSAFPQHQYGQQQYGHQYGYSQMSQSYPQYPVPSTPQMPPMPIPPIPTAPGMGGFSVPAPSANDDGLANVLLAWYQSGYYTGRFQAIQEMNAARNQQQRR